MIKLDQIVKEKFILIFIESEKIKKQTYLNYNNIIKTTYHIFQCYVYIKQHVKYIGNFLNIHITTKEF